MKTPIKRATRIFVLSSLAMSFTAVAEFELGSYITDSGVELIPTLQTGVSQNDNFFSTPDDNESRAVLAITPNLKARIEDGPDYYLLDIGTSTSLHNKDSVDNFTQINLAGNLHKEFTSQHRIMADAKADWLYEPRGSGLTEGLGDTVTELVEYNEQVLNGRYEYGAVTSKAMLALTAGIFNKEYQNFKEVAKYRDYDKTSLGIIGYYNTQSASRLFIELKQEDYRYDFVQPTGVSRDSDDIKALLGIEWDLSAITSGSVKLGYQEKDFSSEQRENFSGLSWDASILWQPLTYSSFNFLTSNAAKDPLVSGDYIEETVYGATWNHEWSEQFSSLLSLNYTREQYTGDDGRDDKTKNLRVGLNYVATKFMMISPYLDILNKDSTQDNIAFDKTIVGINFTFGLTASK